MDSFADDPLYNRTALAIGEENCQKLQASCVLIVGLGGVGGFAAEHLVRAGVGKMILVDGDSVDETNRNRQLSALNSTVGRSKVEVWLERCREINPAGEFIGIDRFVRSSADMTALLEAVNITFAVDAIDEMSAKIELILALKNRKVPFISSMGAGGKLDPARVQCSDISKSFGCPLARNVRKSLKEHGVYRGVKCVFSPEQPLRRFADRRIGSVAYMPAIFGAFCAAEAISAIINEKST